MENRRINAIQTLTKKAIVVIVTVNQKKLREKKH